MTRTTFAAACLAVLPLSTILVGCDRRAEDSAEQKRIEQRALERDLALALRPDSAAPRTTLSDVPAAADTPQAQLPAFVPPPPAAQPKPEVEAPPKVVNLMDALRKSLDTISATAKKPAPIQAEGRPAARKRARA